MSAPDVDGLTLIGRLAVRHRWLRAPIMVGMLPVFLIVGVCRGVLFGVIDGVRGWLVDWSELTARRHP